MGVPALIVAAGSGQRLGAGKAKALVPLLGRPLYEWSVEAFRRAGSIGRILVLVPPGQADEFTMEGIEKVTGGATRSESVANGLGRLDSVEGPMVVHDAARPLVTPELIDRSVAALEASPPLDAVITASPVTDTIKKVSSEGRVIETLDRSELVSVQTPQVFQIASLRVAMVAGDLARATDDAALIEAAGGSVGVVDSPSGNIKVTVPGDLDLAARLLESKND